MVDKKAAAILIAGLIPISAITVAFPPGGISIPIWLVVWFLFVVRDE